MMGLAYKKRQSLFTISLWNPQFPVIQLYSTIRKERGSVNRQAFQVAFRFIEFDIKAFFGLNIGI